MLFKQKQVAIYVFIALLMSVLMIGSASAVSNNIKIFINGQEIYSDVAPEIKNNRTMVPIRVISENLGMSVEWDANSRSVIINNKSSQITQNTVDDSKTTIMGESVATSEQLRSLLKRNNPNAPDLVDLYLSIGQEYGIRGDLAFCQAAKETGWWKFGNLVKPEQNNYCGLGATGSAATGDEDLHSADPSRVYYIVGDHGAYFATPADGVEAQIQHLYAYASTKPLPAGKSIVDPRYTLVTKGIAVYWSDLDGRWAVPGVGYGNSIINDYYKQSGASVNKGVSQPKDRLSQLEEENMMLRQELQALKAQLNK